MERFIRLYSSPSVQKGNVLGFSSTIAYVAHDSTLLHWLSESQYTPTTESMEQVSALYAHSVGRLAVRTKQYHEALGIPIPEYTVSTGHLLIEPPLTNPAIRSLGKLLPELPSFNRELHQSCVFIDNRFYGPASVGYLEDCVITAW